MKILYASYALLPSRYANSIQVMRMCEAMAEEGHEIHLSAIIASNTSAEEVFSYYGIRTRFTLHSTRASTGSRGLVAQMHAVRRLACRAGFVSPDLVYGRHVYSLLSCLGTDLRLVYEVHAPPLGRASQLAERVLLKSKQVIRLVTISNALGERYRTTYPDMADRIVVAHDAAQLVEATNTGRVGDSLNKLDIGFHVGYVGHLYPGKGLEVIVELAKQMPDVDFSIIGGTDEDIAIWRNTTGMKNLHFHGFVPPHETGFWIQAFDVVLAPYQKVVSTSGGRGDISRWMSPLKLFEYMSHGKAMIVSDLPVIREIIADGETGLLVDAEDPRKWVEAITLLREDETLRAALGARAKSAVHNSFTWAQRASLVLEHL